MSLRNIILVIILGLVLLGAIAGEGYFYFYSQKQNSAVNSVIQSIQKTLSTKPTLDVLAEARSNLQAQTDKLKEMQASFPSSLVLDAAIKADVAKAAAAAALADVLAADPKLGISAQSNIVILGQKATQALAYLQYLSTTPASTAALDDAAQNAIDLVAAYVNQLHTYVNSLSPSGSGLTSGEIADYESQTNTIVGQVDSVENSLNQIDSIPASSVPGIASLSDILLTVSTSTNNSGNQGSSNSSTNAAGPDQGSNQSSGQPSGGTSNPSDGSVTLGDIVNQQNIVSDDTSQVNQLSDQAGSDTASSSQDNGNNGGVSTGNNNSGGIQPQSGPVKLIEGENTF
jgi:hypothetical protein